MSGECGIGSSRSDRSSAGEKNPLADPANDAHLIQLVRCALGESGFRGGPRMNVSSCKFVVTLYGVAADEDVRRGIEDVVRSVEGVEDVVNKLR